MVAMIFMALPSSLRRMSLYIHPRDLVQIDRWHMVSLISIFYHRRELYCETTLETFRGEDIHAIL